MLELSAKIHKSIKKEGWVVRKGGAHEELVNQTMGWHGGREKEDIADTGKARPWR